VLQHAEHWEENEQGRNRKERQKKEEIQKERTQWKNLQNPNKYFTINRPQFFSESSRLFPRTVLSN
jgi:hypothetical protein